MKTVEGLVFEAGTFHGLMRKSWKVSKIFIERLFRQRKGIQDVLRRCAIQEGP